MTTNRHERERRDQANVGPDPRQARSLVPMRSLPKLQIADGEPDIRGWPVFTSHGREIGVVEELLVDTTAREVVMLDVDLRRDDRHTLAPLRAAWIDRDTKRVIIDAAELETEEDLPVISRRQAMSDQDVDEFDRRYARAYGDRVPDDYDYRYRYRDDEELRFGRSADAGPMPDDIRDPRRDDEPREAIRREQERLAREREQLAEERERLDAEREQLEAERREQANAAPQRFADRPVQRRRVVERRRWIEEEPAAMPPDEQSYSVRFPHDDRGRDIRRRADDTMPPEPPR